MPSHSVEGKRRTRRAGRKVRERKQRAIRKLLGTTPCIFAPATLAPTFRTFENQAPAIGVAEPSLTAPVSYGIYPSHSNDNSHFPQHTYSPSSSPQIPDPQYSEYYEENLTPQNYYFPDSNQELEDSRDTLILDPPSNPDQQILSTSTDWYTSDYQHPGEPAPRYTSVQRTVKSNSSQTFIDTVETTYSRQILEDPNTTPNPLRPTLIEIIELD